MLRDDHEPLALAEAGERPDYGSGPYLALVGAMVRLALQDLRDPTYSEEARAWLEAAPLGLERGDVFVDVDLFSDCIGYGGSWL